MIERTHINQHKIRSNLKLPEDAELEPVITCKTYKGNRYLHCANLKCKLTGRVIAKVIYSPHKPLSCGARLWIETDTDLIEITDEEDKE